MALTVSDLVSRAGVRDITVTCEDKDLVHLARFCDPWKLVGQHLQVPNLDDLLADESNEGLRRIAVLKRWKGKFAYNATYEVLVNALLVCDKTDEARKVCEFLAKKQSEFNSSWDTN